MFIRKRYREFSPRNICNGGGGGGESSNTTTTSAPQTTFSGSATANVAPVYQGENITSTVTDFGAVQAAGTLGVAAINAGTSDVAASLDAGTHALASVLDFANSQEVGAADLISKALVVAAGNASNTAALSAGAQNAGNPVSQIDFTKLAPVAVAGIVLYMVFKK